MQDKAYAVLDAIRCGTLAKLPHHTPWLKALQTVRWAYESPEGFVLTREGRHALDEMSRNWRAAAASEPHRTNAAPSEPSWSSP